MARKSAQLVCQHLENISGKMLEKYQAVIRQFIRGRNGVYAMYRRGKLYYVGLASSLLGRLRHHLMDHHSGTWDRFSVYLTIGPAHMKEIESLLLRIANPPGNKVRGKFVRSQDLRPLVKDAYRRLRDEEEEDIFGPGGRQRKPERRVARTPRVPKAQRVPLAQYVEHVKKRLRARHKGKILKARVRRDGRIRFGGTIYNSPSRAAAAACGRRARNGWTFWTYERAPGDWVLLDELRK
jgi:hypothetical protein